MTGTGSLSDQARPRLKAGVLSPLLANVALHGLEKIVRDAFPKTEDGQRPALLEWAPTVIRYADDFVVCHRDLGVNSSVSRHRATMASGHLGLELKPSKTPCVLSQSALSKTRERVLTSWASPSGNIR